MYLIHSSARQSSGALLFVGLLFIACGDADGGGTPMEPPTPPPPPPPVASISISLPKPNLEPGETAQASVILRTADGTTLSDRSVTWAGPDSEILSVSEAGVLTARALGLGRVIAGSEGVSDTVSVSVAPAARPGGVTQLEFDTSGSARLFIGGTQTIHLHVTASTADGGQWENAQLTYWESASRFAMSVTSEGGEHYPTYVLGDSRALDELLEQGVLGSIELAPALDRWALPFASAVQPKPETLFDGGASLVLIGAAAYHGLKILTVAVTAYVVTDHASTAVTEYQKNAVILEMWDALEHQCVTVAEVAEFLTNEFRRKEADGHGAWSLGMSALLGTAKAFLAEVALFSADVIEIAADDPDILEDDIYEWANTRWGITPEQLETPSGKVRLNTLRRRVVLSTGKVLEEDYLRFRGIDASDQYCAGRVPSQLVFDGESVTANISETVIVSARVTSDWGNGVEGVDVQFALAPEGGSLSNSRATTDGYGVARVQWAAPSKEGYYEITITALRNGEHLEGSPRSLTVQVKEVGDDYGEIVYAQCTDRALGCSSRLHTVSRTGQIVRSTPFGAGLGGIDFDWSPDGRKLAFSSGCRLGEFDLESEEPKYWVSLSKEGGTPCQSVEDYRILRLAWSPDGNKIAFVLNSSFESNSPSTLKMLDRKTGTIEKLADLPVGPSVHDKAASLQWSKDGKSILFRVERNQGMIQLYSLETKAVSNFIEGWFASWSPSGDRLLVTRNGELFVGNADGSELVRQPTAANVSSAAWSPDSREIVYGRGGGFIWHWDLRLFNLETGTDTMIVPASGVRYSWGNLRPRWRAK